jgi:hypothetical protein
MILSWTKNLKSSEIKQGNIFAIKERVRWTAL